MPAKTRATFTARVLIAVGVITAVVLVLLLVWRTADVLLILFAGGLAAILLNWISAVLSDHTPLSYRWALGLVVLLLLVLTIGGGWLMAGPLTTQAGELAANLQNSFDDLMTQLDSTPWAQDAWQQIRTMAQNGFAQTDLVSRFTGAFSGLVSVLTNVAVVLFISLYLAFEPRVYLSGVIHLVPPARRGRAHQVLLAVREVLRWWLLGRLASMLLLGVLWTIGLWILGIPLAFILGVLATLLAFVPYIGAVLTIIPVLLLALAQGPQLALYALILYLVIQTIESNLLTPLMQRQMISLPPVVTLASQLILGLLFGFMGILLAPALAAVLIVLVKMLYVQDVLGDQAVEPVPGH
ncbi:MAG: AI-2E family transporter [Anaerolineales bacterium]|nr:AI-2E family transporter [Anaerolineales bacterium]